MRASAPEVPSRLKTHHLAAAKPTERGLLFQRGPSSLVLSWGRVQRTFAARVGEAPAERFVFQLVLREHGPACEVVRFEVSDPAEAACTARALLVALGADRCDPCLHTLGEEGVAPRRYLEPEVFDEAVLEAVRFAA